MEATAKFDFEAKAEDDLSFKRGDCLKILQTSGNWYRAEHNGAMGFVPKNYIDIHIPSWYQENTSRTDAQEILMSQPVGAFLIRSSRKPAPGDFSISVRHPADVQHFRVMRDSRGQYYLWSEKFPSLNQLVEYYKKKSISKQSLLLLKETQKEERGDSNKLLPPHPIFPRSDRAPSPAPRQRKTSHTTQVRALYDFKAEEADELEFSAGDIIEVLEVSDQTWWKGQLRGKKGLFPSNYTKPI
ncbi:GRB2-related adapter protein 2b [Haplochromis burtoni]|uniref:GRB2-related adapter protein 2b n=1 Tax=Haplochromis burtoni TaxID=8153 RepID=UPI0003BC74C9|nr:GRB2-related adapter protein 2b [Haplochromis burtoni]XP_014193735.1 GRB2-related adapter protein 2b [Haplochromis burtoni]